MIKSAFKILTILVVLFTSFPVETSARQTNARLAAHENLSQLKSAESSAEKDDNIWYCMSTNTLLLFVAFLLWLNLKKTRNPRWPQLH